MKKCTKCGEVKELGEFGRDKRMSDGRINKCKKCASIARAERYAKNKKRENVRSFEYRKRNIEAILEREKAYRAENRELVAKRTREWRLTSGYSQGEYKAGRRIAYASYEQNRRSLSMSAAGGFTPTQWQARLDYYSGKCIYCGSSESIEIEHRIPLSRGGTNWPANLVPACKSCNCKKGTKTEFEFKNLLSQEQVV